MTPGFAYILDIRNQSVGGAKCARFPAIKILTGEDSAKKAEEVLYEAVKHLETVTRNQEVWGKVKPADGGPEERLDEPELRYTTRKAAIVERHEAGQSRDCKR